jgi:hypothetical protein
MHHRALRRAVPAAATLLGLAALAAPNTYAAGGGGGVLVPTAQVDYNTASIALANFPAGIAVPISVTRDGTTIATATVTPDATGLANLNVPGIVAPEPLACWTGFTPDILPGDTVTIGAGTIVAPAFSVDRPTQIGGDIVLHGTAADPASGAPLPSVDGQLFSKTARFSVGGKGGQTLSAAIPVGVAASIAYDAPGSTHWTARFLGLTPGDQLLAMNAVSMASTVPAAVDAAGAVTATIDFVNPGVAGPVAGCTAPLGRDAVLGSSVNTINLANQNTALTINGSADPNVKAVSLNVGGTVVPATMAGGSWTATVNPANLPDGNLTVAGTYTAAGGAYHGETMSITKDTVAPDAPTASVPAGTYNSAQSVALSSAEGTIHYTVDGSDPKASSPKYNGALNVVGSSTIKAVTVDAAGNVSPVSAFGYTINAPQSAPRPAPPVVVPSVKLPKLKLDALTLSGKAKLRTARKHGLRAIIFAPEGANVVRIKVMRGSKVIDTVIKHVTGDGVLTVTLPHSASARRHLKRGAYTVLVTPGASLEHLGATTRRTVNIR